MKELYTENFKTLMKEIEDDTDKWKYISYLWNGQIYIVKMSILLRTIHKFNAIPIKISMI